MLGVSEEAKDDELKRAYKKVKSVTQMALKFHPDRNHAPSATEAFKKVSAAYQVLNDGEARQRYNANGHDENFEQKHQQQQYYSQNMQDPFDIFANLFGDLMTGGARNGHFR